MGDQADAKKVHCTVMVYIQADDTLANFAVQSLRELKRAANDQVTVAAQFKANEQTDIYRYVFSGKDPDTGELRSSFNHRPGGRPPGFGHAEAAFWGKEIGAGD